MGERKKMKTRYRRFPLLSDIHGIKSSIGEMRGIGHPKQPPLNTNYTPQEDDPLLDEAWFENTIKEKLYNHPDNIMEYPYYGEKIFEEPLVGFVRGNDPLLEEYKSIIGPHHFTPYEIMKWQAEKNNVPAPDAESLSVVSIIMPLTQKTKQDNREKSDWVGERWAQTRLLGEISSQKFVREMGTYLMSRGILAIAPDVTPLFNKKRYPVVGWASPWSHRHMAYAAGLGSFGMHDFFITEKGCAHRAASFVVNLKLEPNRERQKDIHANCLHYQGIKCLKCAQRCPVDAITPEHAHDKERCMQRVKDSTNYCMKNYHIFIYGCGICATGVPCESGIPEPLRNKA